MFPPSFDYHRPGDVTEALDLLADLKDAAVVAGGHGLVPDMKAGTASPGALVDVSDLDLAGVAVDGETVRVGALATHADLAASERLREAAPVLAEAAGSVGDRQIRNRGTVGGNVAEAHPAADPPAAVLAADATVHARGPDGERAVPADDFFRGDGATALADDELVTEFALDSRPGAYERRTHPATGYATVGVAATVTVADGTVSEPRVAATGAADRPVRLTAVEEALVGVVLDDADGDGLASGETAERAAANAGESLDSDRFRSDAHASGSLRASLLPTYAEQAVARALDRAARGTGGGPR